ncbi:MAG: transaldolase [Candidatus Magasanikbacteria bacterium RIFCSPHIGHO2_02_FULL_51_14]|uniref:Transaldolase n=1 Tax=Candidatus Magasanikbacteria bacterium RIFCSPHIGHO2_02_FULL_51_14 TaxID=1798683 RepID=A0A1F6MQH1_9BACT|nr:MAG: transaldolase [Candidatus Magasanikbacteria bacterium RIFCSPHIGHO2_02_FULL_51_14]
MRPNGLATKIFLDSGDPEETERAVDLLGFLDGQTTNPSLIAKSPEAKARLDRGEKFTRTEVIELYKNIVRKISGMIPNGWISVEVYADKKTTADEMMRQAREMYVWIPNAYVKLPTTTAGLEAAEILAKEGMRLNMTLCFSQEQAAAVYSATQGAGPGQIFVSPFVGRLNDTGQNGIHVVEHIAKMYARGDGHVKLLAASIRDAPQLLYFLHAEVDIITAPFRVLSDWGASGMTIPKDVRDPSSPTLAPVPYRKIALDRPWREYTIKHELTDIGIKKFSDDWNSLIK